MESPKASSVPIPRLVTAPAYGPVVSVPRYAPKSGGTVDPVLCGTPLAAAAAPFRRAQLAALSWVGYSVLACCQGPTQATARAYGERDERCNDVAMIDRVAPRAAIGLRADHR